ncbi:hypothetical protein VNO80_31459 [Phaseolus coccineus]|uniref:Uncharacterized protein n=1 Tax=Phaseolus coccineus TaxID=3886 RepID=A0AAN9Q9S0_PHACN
MASQPFAGKGGHHVWLVTGPGENVGFVVCVWSRFEDTREHPEGRHRLIPVASPSKPSSRAVLGSRNADDTGWNLVSTGREVCARMRHGCSFPYLAMRTLGHLMFPFAHLPTASGGWTVSWCGVLRTRGCVSCNEDVVVWLASMPRASNGQDTHPSRLPPFLGFRRILKSRTWSALSSQPCTGKAAHVAGQFSRMRCMR